MESEIDFLFSIFLSMLSTIISFLSVMNCKFLSINVFIGDTRKTFVRGVKAYNITHLLNRTGYFTFTEGNYDELGK